MSFHRALNEICETSGSTWSLKAIGSERTAFSWTFELLWNCLQQRRVPVIRERTSQETSSFVSGLSIRT